MFGKNPIRKQLLHPTGELWVQEMFATIQGEGPFAGLPSIFVRLAGCNLRCWFCDTDFESSNDHKSAEQVLAKILALRSSRKINLIVITGGEPFRQNLIPLLFRLSAFEEIYVQIETAGTLWVEGIEPYLAMGMVTIVCSPKTPKIHPLIAENCGHYKYIISSSASVSERGIPTAETQVRKPSKLSLFYPDRPASQVWLQPCDEQDEAKNQINRKLCVSLALQHGYRISLQTHKILDVR